jgi:hypothetical protein
VHEPDPIDLRTPLSLASSLRFPLQSALARREVVIGALLLLLLPGVGWVLNMGHRIRMVHRMQHGLPAWPAWNDWGGLFRDGMITLSGMVYWHAPGAVLLGLGWWLGSTGLGLLGALVFVAGTVAVPGYMTHYCVDRDPREVFSPLRALLRIREAGPAYWRAWSVALAAMALSFVGLLGLGVLFFVSSVWFWQVAGFSFATVFTQTHLAHRLRP